MELAFVLLFVLLGTGAIVYAAMRTPRKKPAPGSGGDSGAPVITPGHHDTDNHADSGASDGGGGDGGGGGGD